MADTPKEIPIKVTPEYDWSKVNRSGLLVDEPDGFKYYPPTLNKVNCGLCMFSAESVDPESLERMLTDHNCGPHDLGPEPPRWHESLTKMWHDAWVGIVIVAVVYVITAAVGDLPLPWTS